MRYSVLVLLMSFVVSVNSGLAQCQVGESEVIIEIDGSAGQYNSEIFWRLFNDDTEVLVSETVDGFLGSGATERDTLCLQDGVNYRFEAYDTFGDGWNDAIYTIFYDDGFIINSGMPNNGGETSSNADLEESYSFTSGDRPGDDCSSPKEISVGETVNVSTELYSNSYVLDPLFDSGNEAIFSFTPLISEQYAITFADVLSLDRGSLQLFDDCYDNTPTRIAFDSTGIDNNLMEVYENLTAGNTYYIVISNNSADTGIDFIEGNLNVSYSGSPTNISCASAFSLTVDGDSLYSRTAQVSPLTTPLFNMQTQDGEIYTADGDSLFYDFTLATQESILVELGDYDLYNSAFVELEKMENCGEEPELVYRRAAFADIKKFFAYNDLAAGTYRLKIFPPAFYEDEFYVSVKTQSSQTTVGNQNCETALALDVYGYGESTASSSITSIPYFNNTNSGIGIPCSQDSIFTAGTGDVWVKAQVPTSGDLVIETFGEYYDISASADQALETRFSVYTGLCGSITEFYCSDKVEAHQKDTIRGLPQGEEVFIRLWDRNGDNSGLMNVRLIEPEPLPFPETDITMFTDSLHVSFTNISGDAEFFYDVKISADSFQTFLPGYNPATISSYQGQFGVTGLAPATTYYFQIFSTDGNRTNSDTTIFEVETEPFFINTIANGNWSNPNIWAGGSVPAQDSAVNIYHQVNINPGESFDVKGVNVAGGFEEETNVGLWIVNGNLNVDRDVRVGHLSSLNTDSVGVFMFTNGTDSSNLNVGRNMIFELSEINNGEPIRFLAVNDGNSLQINVANEFSFRHSVSDSLELYDKPNIDFRSVDLTVGGNFFLYNDNFNSSQPFNAVFQDSRITADVFELNALENTNGNFQVNFTGTTEFNLAFDFRRIGNGGKIKFTDQSSLQFNGLGYQEIAGAGDSQDSIIYNNLIVDITNDPNSDRDHPVLEIRPSNGESISKVLIEGQLNLINGLIQAENDVFTLGYDEVVFGQNASVVGVNQNSYVNGVASKIGNTPFTYPVGQDAGLRQIRILNNDEFQVSDLVRVFPVNNFCGLTDSLLTNSSLARDRTKEYWEITSILSSNNMTATFEPIIANANAEGITDLSSLELIDFSNGSSLGNGLITDSSFQTAIEYELVIADTARLGLASNLEAENPFYFQRKIASLSSYSAAEGENLTINYSGPFASPTDKVYIGGKLANNVSNTDSSITVTVPSGSKSGDIEIVYEDEKILYGQSSFTLNYNTPLTLIPNNYSNLIALENINGTVTLGQTKMQLGLINGDNNYDAMIVSQDYQPVTVINNLAGTASKEEFDLITEGLTINPTDFKLDLAQITGSLGYGAFFEFEYNSENGIIYFANDGNGNFSPAGDGNVDSETKYNDYLVFDIDYDGFSDAMLSAVDLSSSTSILSGESSGVNDCSPYVKTALPFLQPDGKEMNQIIRGDFIGNNNTSIAYLIDGESMMGLIDIYNLDTANYYSNNSRSGGQIYEIDKISLSNDGISQIVASNQSTNEIEIYSFNSATELFEISTVSLSFRPAKMDSEDINGDGFQDLIVSDQDSTALHVLLNDGGGQLTEELSLSYTGGIIVDFDVVDLNADGVKDFLILQEGGQLSVAYYELNQPMTAPIISASSISTSGFDLSWDSVEFAAEYEIFVSTENDTISSLASDSLFILSDTALTFEAPVPFETYYVFGRAISAAGDTSNYSNSLTIELLELAAPEPSSSNASSTQFDVSWSAIQGADEYQVYVGLDSVNSVLNENDSVFVVSDTSVTYKAPEYSELYYYYVRSISNSSDTSAFSDLNAVKLPVSAYLQQDSLAMVALYETNGGANWINNQNWMTGKLNTWEGLVMNADSLFAINLPSNQLEGVLASDLNNLNFIKDIDISDNNLTDVSALIAQASGLNALNLSGNSLSFEQLEGLSSVPDFIYSNQDFKYDLPAIVFENLGTDISISVEANSLDNAFQWYKDSVQMVGETVSILNLTNAQRSDEGLYYVEINNAVLPELTLVSKISEVKISSLERDVAALRQFYDSTNGAGWSTIIWDTTSEDPTAWSANGQDIIVENNRVVEVNLPENNLTGSIPAVLNDVRGLRSIDLSGNAIESATDLTALPNLTQLLLSGNALGMDDLERNISIEGFEFSNQANFGNEQDQKIPQGSDFNLGFDISGSANIYQWFRNDELVSNADSSAILIDSITFESMGEYRLEVSNEIINAVNPDFRLNSNPVQIIATSSISGSVQDANEFATESGRVYLFSVSAEKSYDSVRLENGSFFQNVQGDGSFEFQNIELGDYVIFVDNDENNYPDLLNTYYPNTIDWELAEIVELRSDIIDNLITMEGEPQELTGTSVLSGYLEEEYEEGERVLPRRRVSGAGVSVRTLSASTREISLYEAILNGELVAYIETDDNGEFAIPKLPAGNYTIKFDIPGVPMNTQSDINFNFTGEDQEALEIAAVSDNGQISVSRVKYTANRAELIKNVTVYPNPSNGQFYINGTESISNIKIINSEGRLIEELSDFNSYAQEVEVNLSNYPNGMYFMQIIWEDGFHSMNKLIKE